MTIITTNLTSGYTDPSLTPIAGVPVVATLRGPIVSLAGTSVTREEKTRTDEFGNWTLALIPNALFGADSYYLLRVGTKEEYKVKVPESLDETPVTLSDALLNSDPVEAKSIFVGSMRLVGDLFVNGNITVTGEFTCTESFEHAVPGTGQLPTFPGSLEIIGDLVVSGTVSAKGTIAVGI